MTHLAQKLNLKPVVGKLLGTLSDRNGSIVASRHGVEGGEKKTLEEIGGRYDITRERVRQIEKASYEKIQSSGEFKLLEPAFSEIEQFLNEHAGVATEEQLMQNLVPQSQRPYLSLVLALSGFTKISETEEFKTIWAVSNDRAKKVQTILKNASAELNNIGKPVERKKLFNIVDEKNTGNLPLHEENIPAVLAMSKEIDEGPFKDWGLVKWPQINPRGVRDKARLVMEKHAEPLHFRELAKKIDEYLHRGKSKKTHPQTAHNEIIKHEDFVLIGRGIYALADWGYVPGSVKDVIINILQENGGGPVAKEEVVSKVLQQRRVQENTILLNLQNKDLFKREGDKYYLA